MNTQQIRAHLERVAASNPEIDPRFQHDAYFDSERCQVELTMVKHPTYLPALASLLAALRPRSILTIGALYGTTESYLLQCFPEVRAELHHITICDIDYPDYNPDRDNGSIIYRNICGTKYGNFGGIFTHIRGSSGDPEVQRRIRCCGNYDVVFVDGEHTREAVMRDMSLAADCLSTGGTILTHDTCLFSSGVPDGWVKWTMDHADAWDSDQVPTPLFFLGLGFSQRKAFRDK